jgi:hypothetical protein
MICKLFSVSVIERVLGEHYCGKADHTNRIWSMVWLALWFDMFVTGSISKETSLDQHPGISHK